MICSWHPTPTSSLASFSHIAQALTTLAFLLFCEDTNLIPLSALLLFHTSGTFFLQLPLPCWPGACPNIPFSWRHLFHCSAVPGGKATFPLPLLQDSNCNLGLAIRHTMCSVRSERGPEWGQSACDNAAVSDVCNLRAYPEAGWGAPGSSWPGPWLLEQSLPQYCFGSVFWGLSLDFFCSHKTKYLVNHRLKRAK